MFDVQFHEHVFVHSLFHTKTTCFLFFAPECSCWPLTIQRKKKNICPVSIHQSTVVCTNTHKHILFRTGTFLLTTQIRIYRIYHAVDAIPRNMIHIRFEYCSFSNVLFFPPHNFYLSEITARLYNKQSTKTNVTLYLYNTMLLNMIQYWNVRLSWSLLHYFHYSIILALSGLHNLLTFTFPWIILL